MFGIHSSGTVPRQETLRPVPGKLSMEQPGFFLKRQIEGALTEAVSPSDWEHSYSSERKLLRATHPSTLGTFTVTSANQEVSLFLDRDGATYDLAYLLGGKEVGSDIKRLAAQLCSMYEQSLALVTELPSLVDLPITNLSGRSLWVLSQTEKGCYLECSTDSGSIRISWDAKHLDHGPYSVVTKVMADATPQDATQWVRDSPPADAAVRKLFAAARVSHAWRDQP